MYMLQSKNFFFLVKKKFLWRVILQSSNIMNLNEKMWDFSNNIAKKKTFIWNQQNIMSLKELEMLLHLKSRNLKCHIVKTFSWKIQKKKLGLGQKNCNTKSKIRTFSRLMNVKRTFYCTKNLHHWNIQYFFGQNWP